MKITTYKGTLIKQKNTVQYPVSKIGGVPVLYDRIEWPKCASCGKSMEFIGQFCLSQPLKLSAKYEMAYVFMCPGEYDANGWLICETWNYQSGANVVILQRKNDTFHSENYQQKIPEYILDFEKYDEPLIDFSDYDIDEEVRDSVVTTMKIGGVPAWLQDNETPDCPICGKPMKFVAQVSSELNGPLDADPSKWDEQEYNSLEFGGDGMGYLFICEGEKDHAEGAFLW